jgi:hypothetical protein
MLLSAIADDVLCTVVHIVKRVGRDRLRALDNFPAALYVTDADGVITYFNPVCIDFTGRQPTVGRDRWCVTWKLYTDGGDFLPHDQCPMAVAIQTKAAVRGATAIAERPNGVRVNFMPFPTPVMSEDGELLGAVNMLVDLGDRRHLTLRDFDNDLQAWRSLVVASALTSFTLEDIRILTGEIETELERRDGRLLH